MLGDLEGAARIPLSTHNIDFACLFTRSAGAEWEFFKNFCRLSLPEQRDDGCPGTLVSTDGNNSRTSNLETLEPNQ